MRLEFELKQHDLNEFYKFNDWYSPEKRQFRLKRRFLHGTIMFLLPYGLLLMSDANFSLSLVLNISVFAFFLFAVGYLGARSVITTKVEKWVDKFLKEGKNKDLIGLRTMEFKDKEIECRSLNSDSRIKIEMIEKIREDENYYFIYLTTISAYVIPKRTLDTEETKKQFRTWLDNNFTPDKR